MSSITTTTTAAAAAAAAANPEPIIHPVFEPQTSTWQYVVADPATRAAVIIDPVLDYDAPTRTVATRSADGLLALVRARGYAVTHVLETHAHADHLSAAFYLRRKLASPSPPSPGFSAGEEEGGRGGGGGADGAEKTSSSSSSLSSRPPPPTTTPTPTPTPPRVGIGKRIGVVQSLFGKRYGIASDEYSGVFDLLLEDDETFQVGELRVTAMHLPGHTPDHMGYRIGDNVFCGDSLFHPALGTARCDFPGGSARDLYRSARKLLSLPDHVKIWTGHDYPAAGERQPDPWTSVGEHRARNKHVRDGVTEDEFVRLRSERDRQLAAPRLVHESLQVNIRAGQLPRVDGTGMRTFKLPVNVQGDTW